MRKVISKYKMVVSLTAAGGGYYRVYRDDVEVSKHIAEREATERAVNLAESHQGSVVYYRHEYDVRAEVDVQQIEKIPPGDFVLNATKQIPNTIGGIIRGGGRGEILPVANKYRGSQTNLIAGSIGDNPVIKYQGCQWSIEELGIWGTDYVGTKNKVAKHSCGMLIEKGTGVGTGKLMVRNCAFGWLKIGVQFGGNENANSDLCHFENDMFNDVDICFLSKIPMAIANRFTNCLPSRCGTFLKVIGGGKHLIDGIHIGTPDSILLHIANDSTCAIGTGNNTYIIRDCMFDARAENAKVVLMDYDASDSPYDPPVNIHCDGGHISNKTYSGPAWEIYQNTHLTIRNWTGLQPGMIQWRQNPNAPDRNSNVHIYGCRLYSPVADLFGVVHSSGVCNVIVENCVGNYGEAVDDYLVTLIGDG